MLLLINGAPGAGKSTLARRYADAHPLALVVEIDAIRMQLGGWQTRDETRFMARDLAVVLIGVHLGGGHDVVVPQYLGRPEFRDELQRVAANAGALMVEVVLTDDPDRIATRFRARRADHARAGIEHPEADLDGGAVEAEIVWASAHLVQDAESRGVPVIFAANGTDAAYGDLCAELERRVTAEAGEPRDA